MKKRTVLPFYGKLSQRLEQEAQAAQRAGLFKHAGVLLDKAKEVRQNRIKKARGK